MLVIIATISSASVLASSDSVKSFSPRNERRSGLGMKYITCQAGFRAPSETPRRLKGCNLKTA